HAITPNPHDHVANQAPVMASTVPLLEGPKRIRLHTLKAIPSVLKLIGIEASPNVNWLAWAVEKSRAANAGHVHMRNQCRVRAVRALCTRKRVNTTAMAPI